MQSRPLEFAVSSDTAGRLNHFGVQRLCCGGGRFERRHSGMSFPTVGFFDCGTARTFIGWRSLKPKKVTFWFLRMIGSYVAAVSTGGNVTFIRECR